MLSLLILTKFKLGHNLMWIKNEKVLRGNLNAFFPKI